MAEWEKQISAMTLVVADLERSKTFYREVFGLSPLDEEEGLAVFGFKNTYAALRKDSAHQPRDAKYSPWRRRVSGSSPSGLRTSMRCALTGRARSDIDQWPGGS
jgi:catechol 2,3-dioxygenase-like lactoylglutathione lyase family enzyme